MHDPVNDNEPDGYAAALTFRDKVFLYYRDTKVLPGEADLLAMYYVAALRRAVEFDADRGPILPGCDEFGPEPSPREIVMTHTHSMVSPLEGRTRQEAVEAGIAAAEREMRSPEHDAFGRTYKKAPFNRC